MNTEKRWSLGVHDCRDAKSNFTMSQPSLNHRRVSEFGSYDG
jgi:hypothetical protein